MIKINLKVKSTHNQIIKQYLKDSGMSNSFIKNLKKETGNILLDGRPVFTNENLNKKCLITLTIKEHLINTITPRTQPLDILYEDEHLLIINKIAGIPTIPSKGHSTDTLANYVTGYILLNQPDFIFRALGRLDKNTSGAVVICKNLYIYNLMLSKVKIQKTYLALVNGKVKPQIINKNIATELNTDGTNVQKRVIASYGKQATTIIKKSKFDKISDTSMLEINILTGRTHQIRLHLSSIGHSIIGDDLYGGITADRMYLHCYKICFRHPITNKMITINCNS